MLWFNLATVVPVCLLVLAGFFGGTWAILALAYMTVFVFTMDRLIKGAAARKNSDNEFPAGEGLLVFLGLSHIALVVIAVMALSGVTGLTWIERGMCFILFGQFFGQVSNANAHELIHKGSRWMRRLGVAVYTTLLFGHHASAHTKVHHVFVGSWRDPNTARLGESVYRFWPRAWYGSFMSGLEAENEFRKRSQTPKPWWTHPYWSYLLGSGLTLIGAMLIAGGTTTAQAFGPDDFIGSVGLFGGNFCPRNTSEADGKLLEIVRFSSLFSLLGTTYGGDGRTTFGLPKLTAPQRGMRYCVVLQGSFPSRPWNRSITTVEQGRVKKGAVLRRSDRIRRQRFGV